MYFVLEDEIVMFEIYEIEKIKNFCFNNILWFGILCKSNFLRRVGISVYGNIWIIVK